MTTTKQKIFIIGASGFLGQTLASRLRGKFLVSGVYFNHPVFLPDTQIFPASLNHVDQLEELMYRQVPDIVINAIGVHDLFYCEKNVKLAENFNVNLPTVFALMSLKMQARYLFFSSAEVYDGYGENYREHESGIGFLHQFGKQKLSAESFVRAQSLESVTFRLGSVLGLGPIERPSLFDRIRAASQGESILLRAQKTHSFLSTDSFVSAVEQVLQNPAENKHSVFNLGGVAMTELELLESYCKFTGTDLPEIDIPDFDQQKRNISLDSSLFQKKYPAWKIETKKTMFENLLRELSPNLSITKWQKTLQTL